jgi:hypothetical protein
MAKKTLEQKMARLNEGTLCSIQTGFWGASAKYDKNKLGSEVPKDIVRAMQDLLDDKTLMDDIRNIQWQAKYVVKNNSMPFPIDAVFFIPKNKVVQINDRLEELIEEFDQRLDKFIRNYGRLIKRFKKNHPKEYRPEKYPSKRELRNKFYIRWTFFSIDSPDSTAGILDPNDYKRAVTKFQSMVDEMEEMAVNIIANDLFARLEKLHKQCTTGEGLHGKTVSSVNRFLDKWKDLWRGNVDEKNLKIIISRLKKEMKSVEISRLKDNEEFRKEFSGKLSTIIDKIQNMPNVALKRKLDI